MSPQTFTQPQTFSIAPTITDASKDKGDNQAATMADLKSVENSAWHQLNVDISANNYHTTGTVLYRAVSSSTIQAMAFVTNVSIDPYGNVAGNIPLFQLPKYSSFP